MKLGNYVLYRHMSALSCDPCYHVGRLIPSRTNGNEFCVQKPNDNTYWTSCEKHSNNTYSLMGYQIVPATEEQVAEALLLALSGEELTIPLEVGGKLVKEYNDQNWRLCLDNYKSSEPESVFLGKA